jgi:hypothetical protein
MEYKDPIWYYMIVPFALMLIQLLALLIYIKCAKSVLSSVKRLQAMLEGDNTLYIPTRKEQEMQRHNNEQERMADNHRILTTQGRVTEK